jgi:hypothetical protein
MLKRGTLSNPPSSPFSKGGERGIIKMYGYIKMREMYLAVRENSNGKRYPDKEIPD